MTRRTPALALATVGAAAVVAAPTPEGLTPAGVGALATGWFAAVCWVTGALPLSITALLVPVWLVALGVYPRVDPAFSGFADPVVALFLATFLLAAALQSVGLDRRVALRLVAAVGTAPRRLVLGLMVAAAALSMVVSNTATAAMLMPVAAGVVRAVRPDAPADSNLHVAALLGTAYGASVGGIGTLVGTPANAIVATQIEQGLGVEVSFLDWMTVGVPVVVASLPIVWVVLLRLYPPETGERTVDDAPDLLADFDPLTGMQRRVGAVFLATATLWVVGGLDFLFRWLPASVHARLFGGGAADGVLSFAVVGVLGVVALVLAGAIDEDDVRGIDWPTLLLFGGGLSLADALTDTGATTWLARTLLDPVVSAPILAAVAAVVALTVLLSELASNTATAAILAPVLVELGRAEGTGVTLAVACAVAASFGFALPVATPPNAIAYGTGAVTRSQMLRAGVALDVLMGIAASLLVIVVAPLLL
ncbi:SLC13 family permease [Halobacterium litoreum]|uniref:SLC13 family permease n=1 Tax=Halobacterium litoreum TaxID=2039234 RepID=A0ABD5NGW8_9EURY|nr:DASS family sodium-coupled anion symporter [Halobacterium litoreum]UHH12602.1 DASS family sodium-coupled anion symporter [Halobacterium litoreum]